jgi:hypothetical protein
MVTIQYTGKDQTLKPEAPDAGSTAMNFRIETPALKDKVHLKVKNRSDKKIGVVVLVNGLSTLYQEVEEAPCSMSRWIIEPNAEVTIRGFYQESNKDVLPFQVVAPESLQPKGGDLAPPGELGLITLYVLEQRDKNGDVVTAKGFRGYGRAGVADSLVAAQKGLETYTKSNGGKNFLVPADRAETANLKSDTLMNPYHRETYIIRYFTPPSEGNPGR